MRAKRPSALPRHEPEWETTGKHSDPLVTKWGHRKGKSNNRYPPLPPSRRARGVRRVEVPERLSPYYSSLRHFSPHAHSPPLRPTVTGAARTRPQPTPLPSPPPPPHGRTAAKKSEKNGLRFPAQAGRALPGQTAKRNGCGIACFVSLPWLAASQLLPPPSPSSHLSSSFPPPPCRRGGSSPLRAALRRRRRRRADWCHLTAASAAPAQQPPPAATAPAGAPAAAAAALPQRPSQPGAGGRGAGTCKAAAVPGAAAWAGGPSRNRVVRSSGGREKESLNQGSSKRRRLIPSACPGMNQLGCCGGEKRRADWINLSEGRGGGAGLQRRGAVRGGERARAR